METDDRWLLFLLWVTDFFGGRWEPPALGPRGPVLDVLLATIIHQLAGKVSDPEIRSQLQATSAKAVEIAAGQLAETAIKVTAKKETP